MHIPVRVTGQLKADTGAVEHDRTASLVTRALNYRCDKRLVLSDHREDFKKRDRKVLSYANCVIFSWLDPGGDSATRARRREWTRREDTGTGGSRQCYERCRYAEVSSTKVSGANCCAHR
jgi:hypothetical protein